MMRLLAGVLLSLAFVPAFAEAPARPVLAVETLDGGRFDLAAERGKWVIVNFWATWCSPCIEEMPALSKFVESHDDVIAIGLAWEDTEREELLAFAKKHPVVYPLAQMDIYAPLEGFAIPRGLPTTYLLDPQGLVVEQFLGPITGERIGAAIEAAKAK